jgi:hypothetical protein
VNGTALGRREAHGWRDVDEVWADGPDVDGLTMNMGPVIERGLALC